MFKRIIIEVIILVIVLIGVVSFILIPHIEIGTVPYHITSLFSAAIVGVPVYLWWAKLLRK